ncbi:MAG: hypothetical protein AB1611_18585 [bacterium]
MEIRNLLEKVQALRIFWDLQLERVIKLKPTTLLDEKDVVALQELSSARGQSVGIAAPDAQQMWKTWGEAYMKVLKLYDSDLDDHAKDLLGEIYGLNAPLPEKKIG